MKTFRLCMALLVCSPAFAAIEFSDDLNGDLPPVEATSVESPIVFRDAAGPRPAAPQVVTSLPTNVAGPEAQSGGFYAGDEGKPRRPLPSRNPMMMGMMRGGGGAIGVESIEDNTDELIPVAVSGEVSMESSEAATTSNSEAVTLPEPSTALVWSILGVCGIALARRFR